MSAENLSVLAQKIERAKVATLASAELTAFAEEVGNSAQQAATDLLDAEFEMTTESGGAVLPDALADEFASSILYWLVSDNGTPCALAAIAPEFAAVVTERLLGGDLTAPGEPAAAPLLHFQMAGSLVDLLMRELNRQFAALSPSSPQLRARRGARSPAEALADSKMTQSFKVDINFAYAGFNAPNALRIFFPTSFVERAGLNRRGGARKRPDGEAASWADRLRRALFGAEIPLTAVLGRFRTDVGELSKLQVGKVFDLEPGALNGISVTAQTVHGPATVAHGRLGSLQSAKAVKLTTAIDQDFLRGL